MIGQFTATYIRKGKWYVGYVRELPGVNTQGRTLIEVKKNLKEALMMVLETNQALTHPRPKEHAIQEPINIVV